MKTCVKIYNPAFETKLLLKNKEKENEELKEKIEMLNNKLNEYEIKLPN